MCGKRCILELGASAYTDTRGTNLLFCFFVFVFVFVFFWGEGLFFVEVHFKTETSQFVPGSTNCVVWAEAQTVGGTT